MTEGHRFLLIAVPQLDSTMALYVSSYFSPANSNAYLSNVLLAITRRLSFKCAGPDRVERGEHGRAGTNDRVVKMHSQRDPLSAALANGVGALGNLGGGHSAHVDWRRAAAAYRHPEGSPPCLNTLVVHLVAAPWFGVTASLHHFSPHLSMALPLPGPVVGDDVAGLVDNRLVLLLGRRFGP